MDVDHISSFTLRGALFGPEQDLDLDLGVQLSCCRQNQERNEEAQCATSNLPHHAAVSVSAWQPLGVTCAHTAAAAAARPLLPCVWSVRDFSLPVRCSPPTSLELARDLVPTPFF